MKRYILFALTACAMFLLGQKTADAQFMIGAGYDRMGYVLDKGSEGNPFDGFSAEIGYTAKFAKGVLGINFGVGYEFNTRRDDSFSVGDFEADVSTQEQYVSVPLRFVIDIPVSKVGIVLYAGGYASYGISGLKTYEFSFGEEGSGNVIYDYFNARINSDEIIPEPVLDAADRGLGESRYSKLEYGVQAGGGLRLGNNVLLHGLYSYGLGNRNAHDEGAKLTRRGFSVRLSFLF